MAKWRSPCAKDMIARPFANMIAQLFANTILHCYQIIIYLFCTYGLTASPWPLDNHKVATSISSVRHMVSLPHGYVVNTTCMSQIFQLDHVSIIKSKFTNLRNIIVNMQVIMSVTAIQWLATVLCYLLHLYVITSVTAIQWLATVLCYLVDSRANSS
jgi:hypothetical protein